MFKINLGINPRKMTYSSSLRTLYGKANSHAGFFFLWAEMPATSLGMRELANNMTLFE